jgi:hypothetical protein
VRLSSLFFDSPVCSFCFCFVFWWIEEGGRSCKCKGERDGAETDLLREMSKGDGLTGGVGDVEVGAGRCSRRLRVRC